MPNIAVDSGVLYAMFDVSDRHHGQAKAFLATLRIAPVANVAVLTEVVYLLRHSGTSQRAFLRFAIGALDIDTGTAADLPRIVEIMNKYSDLPADFADASLMAMSERRGIVEIATLDKDFNVYQLSSGDKLRNVFYDED